MTAEEQKKVEQLMKPRYKVIADWPFNVAFGIGGIISEPSHQYFTLGKKEWHMKEFPHLFKELQWWEDRIFVDAGHEGKYVKEFDLMPEFIKSKSTGNIYKVIWYSVDEFGEVACLVKTGNGDHFRALTDMDIATQQDYESFINSKDKG